MTFTSELLTTYIFTSLYFTAATLPSNWKTVCLAVLTHFVSELARPSDTGDLKMSWPVTLCHEKPV